VSRNLHLACIKEILSMAVADSMISYSPAANFKAAKLAKPIRKTPTFEEFKMIVTDIRSQRFNADAHKGDGKRYIVHSDELLTAFLELEATLL
jgi:hypothetical protein